MKSVLAEGVQNGVEKFCSHATVVGIAGRAAILKLLDIEQFEGKLQCNFAIGHGITFFRMRIVCHFVVSHSLRNKDTILLLHIP